MAQLFLREVQAISIPSLRSWLPNSAIEAYRLRQAGDQQQPSLLPDHTHAPKIRSVTRYEDGDTDLYDSDLLVLAV